jgi:glycosyltransferase involved in cell wall biosynthesis
MLARWSPQDTLALPGHVVRHCYVEPFVRRLAQAACAPAQAVVWKHRAMEWFDRWCAERLPDNLDAVVCYENAAFHTFRAARRRGITTILDTASVHHQWQDAVYDPVEPEPAHALITAHKDREIDLADWVLTVSEFARRSCVEAGLPDERVTSVPMGTNLADFAPPDPPRPAGASDAPFMFLLVGHADRRKGADVLLEASRLLHDEGVEHRVQVAGEVDESLFEDSGPAIERLGYLDREELVRAYQQADVLVLPSRFDSFGRVVVEGMATGLPALVSEHVGAKEVVTEGESGWVVPAEDVDALADRMRWCVRHPEEVAAMREEAVAAAAEYTWSAYRHRVCRHLETVLEAPSSEKAKERVK